MSVLDVVIQIATKSDAESAFGRIVRAVNGTTDRMEEARKKADELRAALRAAEEGGESIEEVARRTKELEDHLSSADMKAADFNSRLVSMRNTAAALSAAGAAGLVLSNSLAEAGREGEAAAEQLDAMLQKRGEGGRFEELAGWAEELAYDAALVDDEPLQRAAAGLLGFGMNADQIKQIMPGLIGQSRLYGQSLDSVAMAMGKAFGKGDVGSLTKSGVVIDEADIEKLKTITNTAERQKFMFELVKDSMDKYALSITEGLGESEIAHNRAALAAAINMGAVESGAAAAQASVERVIPALWGVVGANESVGTGVGWGLTLGSYALTAGGSVLALVAQIGAAIPAFQAMGAAGVFNFAAIQAAALSAAVGVNAVTLGVTGIAIAAAATVGYVGFAVSQHIGWIDKEQTFVERLTAGWYRLSDWILRTQNVSGAAREQNEKDLQAEIDKLKVKNQKAVDDGKMTREQADKANREGEIALLESVANNQRQIGDDANYVKNKERAEQLRQVGTAPAAPAIPSASPLPTAPATGAVDPAKAAAAAAKQQQAATAKALKTEEKNAADIARRKADLEIARLEEDYNTRIAHLNAGKGNEQLAKKLEAEKRFKAAEIRARLDKDSEANDMELARIRYQGELERAAIVKQEVEKVGKPGKGDGLSVPQLFGQLRRGRSIFSQPTGQKSAGENSRNGRSARVAIEVSPEQFKTRELPGNKLEVIFSGRFTVDNPLGDALGAI